VTTIPTPSGDLADPFRHQAMFYAGEDEFVDRASAFISDAVEADERILVVVAARKLARLRERLGADAKHVHFADMQVVGHNPARIIPVWRDFVASANGRPIRGIGEPIWAGRTPAQLVEAQRHESLLNIAFEGSPDLWLLCPYDVETLGGDVMLEAKRSHPYLMNGLGNERSDAYEPGHASAPFDAPLPAPPGPVEQTEFGWGTLRTLRGFVAERGNAWGLGATRVADLVLAVDEIASNSLRHATGAGVLAMWSDGDSVIAEVRDSGRILDPMAGRVRPSTGKEGGFGLWLVNQICDLVQVRTFASGSVVRIHMSRG
jgi:anti-sigma regulatory factor (Ser/Thr protein kinase)